jgi:hypothetical protein
MSSMIIIEENPFEEGVNLADNLVNKFFIL